MWLKSDMQAGRQTEHPEGEVTDGLPSFRLYSAVIPELRYESLPLHSPVLYVQRNMRDTVRQVRQDVVVTGVSKPEVRTMMQTWTADVETPLARRLDWGIKSNTHTVREARQKQWLFRWLSNSGVVAQLASAQF